jgi:hypothetical protein
MAVTAIPPPPRLGISSEDAGAGDRLTIRRIRMLQAARSFLAARPTTASKLWRSIGYAVSGGLLYDGAGYGLLGNAGSNSTGLAVLRELPGLHAHGGIELLLGAVLWHFLAARRIGRVRLALAGVVGYMLFTVAADFMSWFIAVPGHISIAWGVPGRPGGVLVLALILVFTIPVDGAVAANPGGHGAGRE